MINLHIYVALPKRSNQLKMCSPVHVLNQQTVNYVYVSTETVFASYSMAALHLWNRDQNAVLQACRVLLPVKNHFPLGKQMCN